MSNRNLVLLVFTISTIQVFAYSSLTKPKRSTCRDDVQIKDCRENTGNDVILTFHRIKANQLIANFETDCKFDSIMYKWTLFDSVHDDPIIDYETNNVFVIDPFALRKGMYAVLVTPKLTRNGVNSTLLKATCGFKMEALDPIPVIDGGTQRTVEARSKFLIDGSKSIDRDVPPKEPEKLSYKWKCKLLSGQNTGFCNQEYKGSTLEVPSNHAISGNKYLFILNVRSQDSNTWVSSEQTVTVLTDVSELKIVCEKNCPPAAAVTDSRQLTFLRVKCLKNCDDVEDSSYEWSIDVNFDYDTKTQFGRSTSKFIIKKESLEDGKKYTVSVKLKNRKGSARCLLQVGTPIKINTCTVEPPQGVALETKFAVNCSYTGDAYTFEIFTSTNEENIVLTKTYSMNQLNVMLSPNSNLYIQISDINSFQDVYSLDVTVNPPTKDVATLVNSLQSLVSQENTDATIQTVNVIVDEIRRTSTSDPTIKHSLVKTLKNLTMKSQSDASHIAAIVTKIVNDPQAESNPYQGEIATEICKKASEILLSYLEKEYYPTTLTTETQNTTKLLTACAETDSKKNFEILKPESLDFDITTSMVLDLPVITEDYPDYETDASVAEKQQKFQLISTNVVGICENSLEMLDLTVVEGEDTVGTTTSDSSVEITKLVGQELVEDIIEIQSTLFWLSRDFEKSLETVDVKMCSWRRDPFWWNVEGRVVATNVVLVKIRTKNKEITQFERPNQIIFNVQNDQEIKTHELSSQTVIRIDVKKGESFFVQFQKLSASASFRALVNSFYKPKEEEVREKGALVTQNENILYQNEDNNFDSWYYLTVLPESENESFTFFVHVFTKSCYFWNSTIKAWRFACKGVRNVNPSKIECACTHLSILSGVVYNNPIRIDKVFTNPDFELTILSSFVIFIAVATTFGIYCLLLTIILKTERSKSQIVFLTGDISASSRYVYMLAIRTGKKPSSGTSSNIGIQIFGDLTKSNSHILNFPDPQQRIFQRSNTDWFILPTVYRLGNIAKIALWSDYSGHHPRWYCLDVTISDLQTQERWYFHVNRWLDLPPSGHVFVTIAASTQRKKRFRAVFFKLCPRRTLQKPLSSFLKLTLLLSVVLTNSFVCLVLYGIPTLTLKDGFAEIQKYEFHPDMIWIGFVSSVVGFGFHLTLILLFRRSQKWVTFGWLVLTINVSTTLTVLVVFGFWVPTMVGFFWLTSVVISVILSVHVFENLVDICMSFCTDEVPKWDQNWRKMLDTIEVYRIYLFQQFGKNLLRPYFEYLYQPMDDQQIKERKLHIEYKRKLLALLEDTLMFICYVSLLYLAIFANKNKMTVRNHIQILDLLSGKYTQKKDYVNVRSLHEIYDYLNNTLIPTLHASQWYGKYVVKDPGMMADFHNKFLGVTRLRQRRVQFRQCKSTFIATNTCRSEFWTSRNSYKSFGPGYNDFDRLGKVWNYTHSAVAGISMYVGKFGIYYGGGFIAPLGRTLYNSYANLFYLKNNSWLDRASGVVIVEFLAYNVNTNLFNAVKLVFERSATGYRRNKVELSTAQFLFVKDEQQTVQSVIFASFVFVVFVFTLKVVVRLWEGKFLVWKDLWTLVDLLIVALSYTCFTVFVHRAQSVKKFLDKVENLKKNEFINYFHLLYEETTFTLIAAFLVFVATIRLWKVCRFGTIFRIMENSIVLSFRSIIHVLVLHMVLLITYTLSGYLLFGTTINNFRDISNTLVSLFLLTTGLSSNFDLENLVRCKPTVGRLYYTSFMIVTLWFLTVYVCVLMIYYYESQTTSSKSFQTICQFVSKEYRFYRTALKMKLARLRGGTKIDRVFVTPKSDDLRYADCLTLPSNTLELMRCIVVRNLKKFMTEEEKFKIMKKVVRCCFEDDSIDVFFSQKNENYVKIIHDDRIQLMAAAAECVFNYEEKVDKKEEKKNNKREVVEQVIKKLDFIQQMLNATLRIVSNIEIE